MPALIQQLWDLQQLDVELDRLRHEIRALQARVGETPTLTQVRDAARQADADQHAADTDARDRDLAVGSLRAKLAADEKKLYDGSIRNNKELADLHQQVEHEKTRLRQLEDAQIEAMTRAEALQRANREAQATLVQVERDWQTEQARLTQQIDTERAQGRAARRKRDEAVTKVDPAALALYQKLMVQKAGRAVARVEQNLCLACRVNVPLPVANRARASATPVTCPSCGRILLVAR